MALTRKEDETPVVVDSTTSRTVTTDPTPPSDPDPTPVEPEVVEEPTAKLKAVEGVATPFSLSVVGLEDELTFKDGESTYEVPLKVAEQVTYLPNVEVVA